MQNRIQTTKNVNHEKIKMKGEKKKKSELGTTNIQIDCNRCWWNEENTVMSITSSLVLFSVAVADAEAMDKKKEKWIVMFWEKKKSSMNKREEHIDKIRRKQFD